MKAKELIKKAREFAAQYRVTNGAKFGLKDYDPSDTMGYEPQQDRPRAKEVLQNGADLLAELQDKLYAQDKWAVVLDADALSQHSFGQRDHIWSLESGISVLG